eukprot:5491388-Amphidinium_carterae.1
MRHNSHQLKELIFCPALMAYFCSSSASQGIEHRETCCGEGRVPCWLADDGPIASTALIIVIAVRNHSILTIKRGMFWLLKLTMLFCVMLPVHPTSFLDIAFPPSLCGPR